MGLEDRFKIPQAGIYDGNDLIGASEFGALLREYARTNITAGEAADALNDWIQTPFTIQEQNDLDAVRALIDAGGNENSRILIATLVGDVLVLGEQVTTGYTTRAEMKAKIGF